MKLALEIRTPGKAERLWQYSGYKFGVGRDPECALAINGDIAELVSWRHAQIELHSSGPIITDERSTNGTYVNGNCIQSPTVLRVGDEIWLGKGGPRIKVVEFAGDSEGIGQPIRSKTVASPRTSNETIPPSARALGSESSGRGVPTGLWAKIGLIAVAALVVLGLSYSIATQGRKANLVSEQPTDGPTKEPAKSPSESRDENDKPPPTRITPVEPSPVKLEGTAPVHWELIAKSVQPGCVWIAAEINDSQVLLGSGWLVKPDTVVTTGRLAGMLSKEADESKYRFFVAASPDDATSIKHSRVHPRYNMDDRASPSSMHYNIGLLFLDSPRKTTISLVPESERGTSLAKGSLLVSAGFALEFAQLGKTYVRDTVPIFNHHIVQVGDPDVATKDIASPRRQLKVTGGPSGMFGWPVVNRNGNAAGMAIQIELDEDYSDDPVYCVSANAIQEALATVPRP